MPLLDYGARLYSTRTGQWVSPDPLGEEYRSVSPYAYCAGNPVDFVDPDGMDYYMFDSNGKYQEKIQAEGTHRILIHSTGTLESGEEYDQYTFVDFADPESDPEAIDSGEIDQLVFVSEEEISSVLDVFVESDLSLEGFYNGSAGGAKYDYYSTYVSPKYEDSSAKLFRDCRKKNKTL